MEIRNIETETETVILIHKSILHRQGDRETEGLRDRKTERQRHCETKR